MAADLRMYNGILRIICGEYATGSQHEDAAQRNDREGEVCLERWHNVEMLTNRCRFGNRLRRTDLLFLKAPHDRLKLRIHQIHASASSAHAEATCHHHASAGKPFDGFG